jgi:hypothetical protein
MSPQEQGLLYVSKTNWFLCTLVVDYMLYG